MEVRLQNMATNWDAGHSGNLGDRKHVDLHATPNNKRSFGGVPQGALTLYRDRVGGGGYQF